MRCLDRGELNAGAHGAPCPIRIGYAGFGRIGAAVARLVRLEASRLRAGGVDPRNDWAIVRDPGRPRGDAAVRFLPASGSPPEADVIVEAMGGIEPARSLVAAALQRGTPVVSANKTLVAHDGPALLELARSNRTTFSYDAAVVAGVPFVGSLARRPLLAAPVDLAGILNGTSHLVLDAVAHGATLRVALDAARASGLAEPDSTADISGRDAAEKLTIVLHLCGRQHVRPSDFTMVGIDRVDRDDIVGARRLGGTIKPIARASLGTANPGAWVGPAFVFDDHPFASLTGVDNVLTLWHAAGGGVTFSGPGAGPDVTARTILDDLVEAVRLGQPQRQEQRARCESGASDGLATPPAGRWFLGFDVAEIAREGHIAEFLAARGLPAVHLIQDARRAFALTAGADWHTAVEAAAALDALGGRVLLLPIFEREARR